VRGALRPSKTKRLYMDEKSTEKEKVKQIVTSHDRDRDVTIISRKPSHLFITCIV